MNSSLTVKKIGTKTEKGNVTIQLNYKKGLMKDPRTLNMLADADDVAALEIGQDITELVPKNFHIRESKWIVEETGEEAVSFWIELV